MLENWKNWCRLCARKDCVAATTSYKKEIIKNQFDIVNRIFMISLQFVDETQLSICDDCSTFLAKADSFRNQCVKVDQMFNELLIIRNHSDEDLQAIRIKFGVDSEEIKFNPGLEEKKENILVPDEEFSDPLETSFVDDAVVKEEQNDVPLRRRRGRPRKLSKLPLNKVKLEKRLNESTNAPDKPNKEEENLKESSNDESEIQLPEWPEKKKKRGRKPLEKVCKICAKTFTRFDSLKNHLMIVHRQSEMPYVCSKCPKRFVKVSSLKMHERSHLPDDERLTSVCPLCDKKFSTKGSVKVHLKSVHTNEKFFICEDCGKSFKTKTALNEHRIVHSNEYPFHCSYCPKKFKNLPAKKLHEETHTDTKFECPTCGLKLNTKRTLRLHMVVHSDKRKYKCNYCGNDYKRAKTLKDHLLLHTGQRPYECPFCDKTFTTGSNCRSHKKKEHPVELAALEASGQQSITNLPKLHDLQSKLATSIAEAVIPS
ncbi:zinc finger protein weckle-like [Lutzomyia longipalpis]|uniref:zinc finger protein weckle-like n=1 Tax=Lutzomyia longipalpis TaxID=7200 RepID=UPI0024842C00|nr:zinc finger protein weckle-like [Lutzomyia longipalpis]